MKNTAVILAAMFIITVSCTQSNVPKTIKATFQKQYPEAKEVKWEKEGEHYEAEFEWNKTETSVVYDNAGNLLETETGIETKALPASVLEYTQVNYKGQSIKEAAKITDAKGTITYEAEIKGSDLIFDKEGIFIKAIKK